MVVATMESTMSEQLKLTPRRKNLAARTRILAFCRDELDLKWFPIFGPSAYQVSYLLLVRGAFCLLEYLFFSEGRAFDGAEILWRSTWRFESTFQWTPHR
jgi:hypothetical protein